MAAFPSFEVPAPVDLRAFEIARTVRTQGDVSVLEEGGGAAAVLFIFMRN